MQIITYRIVTLAWNRDFPQIYRFISEMIQDKTVVAMEYE